jgi:hypothetical protein
MLNNISKIITRRPPSEQQQNSGENAFRVKVRKSDTNAQTPNKGRLLFFQNTNANVQIMNGAMQLTIIQIIIWQIFSKNFRHIKICASSLTPAKRISVQAVKQTHRMFFSTWFIKQITKFGVRHSTND